MNGVFIGIVLCGIAASIFVDLNHWRKTGKATLYVNIVLYVLVWGLLIPQIMRIDVPMPTALFVRYVSPFVKLLLGI